MQNLVEVSIPLDEDVAAELDDVNKRKAVGRMVSRLLRPQKEPHPLIVAMEHFGAEAQRRGLTPEILEEEIAAYKAERRGPDDRAA